MTAYFVANPREVLNLAAVCASSEVNFACPIQDCFDYPTNAPLIVKHYTRPMSKRYTPAELIEGFSQLHTLPEVYFRIKAIVDNPKSQASELVRELGTDPALTARVLRVVNSPLYGMSGKVETLLRAVTILGIRAIHDLVLATSITGMLARKAVGELDLRSHWRLSLAIGLIARSLGQALRFVDKDRMFVEGLLSRLGEIVMHDRIGAIASVVSRHAQSKGLALQRAQYSFLGCHYGEVGAALLRKWQLPESLCNAVAKHPDPVQDAEAADITLLRLAANLAPMVEGDTNSERLEEFLRSSGLTTPEIATPQLTQILKACRDELESVQQAVMPTAISAA